jgi:hypothetical protein
MKKIKIFENVKIMFLFIAFIGRENDEFFNTSIEKGVMFFFLCKIFKSRVFLNLSKCIYFSLLNKNQNFQKHSSVEKTFLTLKNPTTSHLFLVTI